MLDPLASLGDAKAEMEFALMVRSVLQGACLRPDRLIAPAMQHDFSGLGSSFLRGWRSMPGITPPTSQLDWLISTTAITATWVDSRAYRISHLARRSPRHYVAFSAKRRAFSRKKLS